MIRSNRFPPRFLAMSALFFVACGQERAYDVELSLPTSREARVSLTPALDVARLFDPGLADRIVIDEIHVGVSQMRLLGANPEIPVGGHRLIADTQVLATIDGESSGRFPFPGHLLDDDLAIYLRIEGNPQLAGASVIVRAHLYEEPPSFVEKPLSKEAPNPDGEPIDDPEEAPNPDGEPIDDPDEAPNPDGEPIDDPDEAPNPDGEPISCVSGPECDDSISSQKKSISDRAISTQKALSFELRGDDVVDLVVGFDRASRMNAVIGIPAERWFTSETIAVLEQALADLKRQPSGQAPQSARRTVVVDRDKGHELSGASAGPMRIDDYRLIDDRAGNPDDLRRR